jgi:selT/selW/selH-like putative selenoprotein
MEATQVGVMPKLPRVAITYCTQCKWLLRAAWMQQEVLSTFGTSIGEIALIPATGGIFTVQLSYLAPPARDQIAAPLSEVLIWDRKRDGGFPEAKILKQLIRNHIDPDKNLGHSDTPSSKAKNAASQNESDRNLAATSERERPQNESTLQSQEIPCDDCK